MLRVDVINTVSPIFKKALQNAASLPMDEIGELLIESVRQNFIEEGRPPWDQRVQPTGSWPILNRSGDLLNSIYYSVTGVDSLVVDHNTSYGDYLDQGTWKMTARPFLVIQDEDIERIEDMLIQHIVK